MYNTLAYDVCKQLAEFERCRTLFMLSLHDPIDGDRKAMKTAMDELHQIMSKSYITPQQVDGEFQRLHGFIKAGFDDLNKYQQHYPAMVAQCENLQKKLNVLEARTQEMGKQAVVIEDFVQTITDRASFEERCRTESLAQPTSSQGNGFNSSRFDILKAMEGKGSTPQNTYELVSDSRTVSKNNNSREGHQQTTPRGATQPSQPNYGGSSGGVVYASQTMFGGDSKQGTFQPAPPAFGNTQGNPQQGLSFGNLQPAPSAFGNSQGNSQQGQSKGSERHSRKGDKGDSEGKKKDYMEYVPIGSIKGSEQDRIDYMIKYLIVMGKYEVGHPVFGDPRAVRSVYRELAPKK